jgi:N-acetylmuramoyl-L-alanine amidase
MRTKNIAAVIAAVSILFFIGYIFYEALKPPVPVVIQAGHEGRTCGNTGAVCATDKEVEWNVIVADAAAKQLRTWGIKTMRIPADVDPMRAEIAVAIHFDSAERVCRSGASVGYPDNNASRTFAQHWKAIYRTFFPFGWHEDNFTENLKNYYAYTTIRAEKFLVLELGELTCEKQRRWLKPRLEYIGKLIAYAIAKERGLKVRRPSK